jgi:hypothetical protein
MKKTLLIAAFFMIGATAAMAQLPSFNLGIKGGVNYSELKSKEDLTDANSILGYQFGVWTRLGGAGIYLQPEVYLGAAGRPPGRPRPRPRDLPARHRAQPQ